jgi:two-component system, response regulator PdtaR
MHQYTPAFAEPRTMSGLLNQWRMNILIVEDAALIAMSLAVEIMQAGHKIVGPTHSAAAAVTLMRAQSPELAFIDIDLETSGEGIALARQLRSEFGLAVIFTTGQPDTARANADCAIGLLVKPYDPRAIIEVADYAAALLQGQPAPMPSHLAAFEAFATQVGSGLPHCR